VLPAARAKGLGTSPERIDIHMEDFITNEEAGRDAASVPQPEQDAPGARAPGALDTDDGHAEMGCDANQGTRAEGSGEGAFRIGEVSRLTGTKAFVLRYWETEFPELQPVKSPSGHRLYRRQDIETVFEIKRLLYEEGFTIAGARRYLSERRGAEATPVEDLHGGSAQSSQEAPARALRKILLDLREELQRILTLLQER
jgi:DNA-binding transcriptional MerR regulator